MDDSDSKRNALKSRSQIHDPRSLMLIPCSNLNPVAGFRHLLLTNCKIFKLELTPDPGVRDWEVNPITSPPSPSPEGEGNWWRGQIKNRYMKTNRDSIFKVNPPNDPV
jgi:hypothetical protein